MNQTKFNNYLTPNSRSVEKNLQKSLSSNESKNWTLPNDEQKPEATNLCLHRLKLVPLPGLTAIGSNDVRHISSPNGLDVQISPKNAIKRPPPPPVPQRRPPVVTSPTIHRESSNSCSSLSSTLTSRSAQSTNSSREEQIPDFVDIEPGLRNRDWFHGKLTREEAEDLLIRLNKKGGFLIRYKQVRTRNIPYTLSIFCDKVYHLHVRYITAEYSYALGIEKVNEMTFKDLQTLVNHHKEKPLQLIRADDFSLSGSTKLTCSPKKR